MISGERESDGLTVMIMMNLWSKLERLTPLVPKVKDFSFICMLS